MKIAIMAAARTSARRGDVSAGAWVDAAVESSAGSFIAQSDCTHEAKTAAREHRIRPLYWEGQLQRRPLTKEDHTMANPFVHVELHSNDLKKAKEFYSKLFGW